MFGLIRSISSYIDTNVRREASLHFLSTSTPNSLAKAAWFWARLPRSTLHGRTIFSPWPLGETNAMNGVHDITFLRSSSCHSSRGSSTWSMSTMNSPFMTTCS